MAERRRHDRLLDKLLARAKEPGSCADPDEPELQDDTLGGFVWCAPLDDTTPLECLLLDGTISERRRPRLGPGCVCVCLPKSESFCRDVAAAVGGSWRGSQIGLVPGTGGAYKRYLIEVAQASRKGRVVPWQDRVEIAGRVARAFPEEPGIWERIVASIRRD